MVLPLMYDDLVEPVAAGEVVAFKAVLHENPAGKIAAQPAVAIHIDWFTAFQLRQPFAEFIEREVDRPLDMPSSYSAGVRVSSRMTLPSRGRASTLCQWYCRTRPERTFSSHTQPY